METTTTITEQEALEDSWIQQDAGLPKPDPVSYPYEIVEDKTEWTPTHCGLWA